MPIIAIVNRKGGSGKSTLATHLAACYANAGLAVMLGDVDRQQSTQTWLRSRGARNLQRGSAIVGWAVDPKRVLRPPAGVSHVVLDTPGGLRGFELARVVAFADVVLMPVCHSAFDRESAADCLAEMLALPRVASGRCKVAAVGMRLDARTRAVDVLRSWAAGLGLPFIGVLRESQTYVRGVEQGLTLFDLPAAQAAGDLAQWQPIIDWLELQCRSVARPTSFSPLCAPNTALPVHFGAPGRVVSARVLAHATTHDEAGTRDESEMHAARRRAATPHPKLVAAVTSRLAAWFGWPTTPRFLHRNT